MGALHHVRGVKEGWGWLPRATDSGQDVCGKLGLGDSVYGLLGASVSVPPGWNPRRGAPGGRSRRLLEASQALRAPWGRLHGAGPALGPTDGLPGCRDRRTPLPQALSAPGASPGHSPPNTHSPQAPRPPPGRTGTCPTAPSSAALLPTTGPAPGALGDRWRAVEVINSRAPRL